MRPEEARFGLILMFMLAGLGALLVALLGRFEGDSSWLAFCSSEMVGLSASALVTPHSLPQRGTSKKADPKWLAITSAVTGIAGAIGFGISDSLGKDFKVALLAALGAYCVTAGIIISRSRVSNPPTTIGTPD